MAADPLRVAVLGASGYVGGELLRLLSGHPSVGEVRGASESAAGRRWSEVHPSLAHGRDGVFSEADVADAGAWADAVFLAMPHGRSQGLMTDLLATEPRLVIDTAADFRVHEPGLYAKHYGSHAAPALVDGFAYGLADVVGNALNGARGVAAPGCFATAALLALFPFAPVLADWPTVFAVTGSSGAGSEPRRTTHHPIRAHSFFAYDADGHRHEAEIAEQLRGWTGDTSAAPRLIPHSAPLVRGIYATARVRLREPAAEPLESVRRAYVDRPFVRVTERPPELAAVVGTNFAHLHAVSGEGSEEVVVFAAIDNLIKGAAGQAVQAMNLALGLDETEGLTFPGIYPC